MAKFGYVKIVSGQAARRIGRFIGWDEKGVKAKVAFMILIFYHILIIIFLASIALLTILQNRT